MATIDWRHRKRSGNGAPETISKRVSFAFGEEVNKFWRLQTRSQRADAGWRKVEDEVDAFWEKITRPLKSLALPRGIEPLFQP